VCEEGRLDRSHRRGVDHREAEEVLFDRIYICAGLDEVQCSGGVGVDARTVQGRLAIVVRGVDVRPLAQQGGDHRGEATVAGLHQRRPPTIVPGVNLHSRDLDNGQRHLWQKMPASKSEGGFPPAPGLDRQVCPSADEAKALGFILSLNRVEKLMTQGDGSGGGRSSGRCR